MPQPRPLRGGRSAIVATIAAAAFLLLTGCGDPPLQTTASTETVHSTRIASPIPSSPASTPRQSFDADAQLLSLLGAIADAVAAKEPGPMQGLTTFADIRCDSGGETEPSCTPGETVSVIPVALISSEAYFVTESGYAAFWAEYITNVAVGQSDEFGPPEARLYAYGARRSFGGDDSPPAATAAITRIAGPQPERPLVPGLPDSRQLMLLDLKEEASGWHITQLLLVPITNGLHATVSDLFPAWKSWE